MIILGKYNDKLSVPGWDDLSKKSNVKKFKKSKIVSNV